MFCACEVKQLFSVMFYVVKILHTFFFRPNIHEIKSHAVIEIFSKGRLCILPTSVASVKILYLRYAGQLHSVEQRKYFLVQDKCCVQCGSFSHNATASLSSCRQMCHQLCYGM